MTDNSRMTRKDLKGPDEFITAFTRFVEWFRNNQSQVLGAAAAVVLLVAAVFGIRSYFVWQEAKAARTLWPQLNIAREILQAPGQADDAKLVSIEQFLSSYVNMHPKAEAAVYAHYYLGGIAFARRNYDISIAQYKSALDLGKDRGVMRFLIRLGLAKALESKGDYSSASVAYREASAAAPGDLKFQSKLGEARVASLAGRGADAATIYREIIAGNPDPATKEFVETKIASLK
jgi:tetratricopeptide (TPR) repeat protein